MDTINHEPRVNRDGHPCPPWCTHHHPDAEIHRTDRTEVEFWKPGTASWVSVAGIDYCHGDGPEVAINGWRQIIGAGERISPFTVLSPRQGLQMAELIEVLQDATPEQHREIAAAIRQAAAIADGAR